MKGLVRTAVFGFLFLIAGAVQPVRAHEDHGGTHPVRPEVLPGKQGYPDFKWEFDPDGNIVGNMNRFTGRVFLAEENPAAGAMEYDLTIFLEEDQIPALRATLFSPNGTLQFGNEFFDGSEHRLILQVRPASGEGGVTPFTDEEPIEVTAVHPPHNVAYRTWFLLVAWFGFGILSGFAVGERVFKKP